MYKYYWRYGKVDTWNESIIYNIGASDLLNDTDIEYNDNTNSVYVSWAGSDTTGDGTQELPYRTIQHAKDNMESGHSIITILDSNYYYSGDAVNLFFDLDGIVLQGIEGHKPVLRIDTNIANQTTMLRLQNASKIINIEIQVDEGYTEQVTAIDARDGTIKNVTVDGANKNGVQKTTTGVLDIVNTIIKNSINDGVTDGNGITISEGTINLSYSLICGNDYAGIIATGSSTKVIDISYNIIADNQYGIYVSGSSNLSLTIDDSINYKNNVYDHYGSDGVYSYSCVGKIQGSPTLTEGTNIIRINPLFVSDTDYRLRSKYNGFGDTFMTSPCLAVSSGGSDLGCYQYIRSLSSQDYQSFMTFPPESVTHIKSPVDGRMVIVNALKAKFLSRGFINKVTFAWNGDGNVLTEDEYNNLALMFAAEGNVFLSIDEGITYDEYVVDKTADFRGARALNIIDNTLYKNVSITLYEV